MKRSSVHVRKVETRLQTIVQTLKSVSKQYSDLIDLNREGMLVPGTTIQDLLTIDQTLAPFFSKLNDVLDENDLSSLPALLKTVQAMVEVHQENLHLIRCKRRDVRLAYRRATKQTRKTYSRPGMKRAA
jgi:hypothetical protein